MWSRLGRPVYLVDRDDQQLLRAKEYIEKLRAESQVPSLGRWGQIITSPSQDLPKAVSDSWLLVECVPESLALKRKVIQQLDDLAHPDTIVASNSSSYTITEIIQDLRVKQPDRFIGLPKLRGTNGKMLKAIEIMGSGQTKPEILSRLVEETRNHGFKPFQVHRTSTGYIYNRIWAAIKRETLLTLAEGVASPEEIDSIFKDVLKTPKGPCEQMDVVGLDVVLDIEQHYADVRQGIPEEPRALLRKMVAQGKLGVKSGSGFYDYSESSKPRD
ncbi:hypothetical protein H2199_001192 [Coniosporium tulheliwenetii]|uniref:Uncharacterized protein n=1 Tax=Coniosporium tulheliwenetii TaxID=3383036 RepID=A0ACC2ZLA0_9PEZI|nr:hypothetical protein H2199_001192 [Cladosporium sp. JES 115]